MIKSREEIRASLIRLLHTYKYVLAVAAAGLLLLLWPSGQTQPDAVQDTATGVQLSQSAAELEAKLEDILSRAEGVGRVAVSLSVSREGEAVYAEYVQQDTSRAYTEGFLSREDRSESRQTLVVDTGDGESAVVVSRLMPTYQGALIVCQGADRADIRLQVTRAVAGLTGLSTDRIVVMKMKD